MRTIGTREGEVTIGIGKAARSQERAARQARSRSIERSSASADLPDMEGADPCASCGERLPRAELMFTEDGGLCQICYGEAESVRADALAGSGWWRVVPQIAAAAPLAGWAVLCVQVLWTSGWGSEAGLMARIAAGVCVFGFPGLLSLMLALGPARELRTALRPSVVDGRRDWWAFVPAALAASVAVPPPLVLFTLFVLLLLVP